MLEVTNGNQGQNNDAYLKFCDCQTPILAITPQMCLNLQIPYYPIITHLVNHWLLGTTNGNQGQKMMDFQNFETIAHP